MITAHSPFWPREHIADASSLSAARDAHRCPICGSTSKTVVTERRNVPVHQNMVHGSEADARAAARGDLTVVACSSCGFAYNSSFDASLMSYGSGYESDQSHSPAFASHVEALLLMLLNEKQVRDARIVEVGSGKGTFLRALVEAGGTGSSGWGFDPSYVGPETDLDGRLRFVRAFFTKKYDHLPIDVAICRHVLEHVPDPLEMLGRIRGMARTPRVFIETKDVEWILRNAVIWDFFYEYCSYFSRHSISAALRLAGFERLITRPVFGGQYLWAEATTESIRDAEPPEESESLESLIASYRQREVETRTRWECMLARLRKDGPIAIWGAGAKGVTFTSLFDPNANLFECVVDINPAKQGRFVAGSGHRIVSPSELTRLGVRNVVLLNPNYVEEIRELLCRELIDVELVTDVTTPCPT